MFSFLTKKKQNGLIEVEEVVVNVPPKALPTQEELFDKAVKKQQEQFLYESVKGAIEKLILGEDVYNPTVEAEIWYRDQINPPSVAEIRERFPSARVYSDYGAIRFHTDVSAQDIYSHLTKQIIKENN